MKFKQTGMILIIALAFTSALAFAGTKTQINYEYDCGLLQGVVISANVLTAGTASRWMGLDGWIAKFETNAARAKVLSKSLDWSVTNAKTHGAKIGLRLVKTTLNQVVSSGEGDVYYWRDMVAVQFKGYTAVAKQLRQLRDAVCSETTRKY